MNDKKVFFSAAAAAATLIWLIFFGIDAERNSGRQEPAGTHGLTVAIDPDMPGVFKAEGGLTGYPLQILESYAADAGVQLGVADAGFGRPADKMLAGGDADMTAGISSSFKKPEGAVTLYETFFSVLGRRESAKDFGKTPDSALAWLGGSRIVISQAFKSTKSYHMLLDSLEGAQIFVSSKSPAKVFKELAAGKYDYYVCEKSEARMGASLDRNLRYLHTFDEQVEVFVSFKDGALAGDLEQWLSQYRRTNEYAALTYLYFEQGAASQLTAAHHPQGSHVISPYDHVMRTVGEREGADWRLMAAIAYNESRFEPDVVSKVGAKGLMQIMPVVSRQFGVADDKVMDPEVNITLAVKLLNRIEKMMEMPDGIHDYDRMALVLASYNCGVGHVADARRLAAKYGSDPNSWDDVSQFLQKKAQPEYYQDGVVRNGRLRDSAQTIAFVSGVMKQYNSYCTLAAL